MAGVVFNDIPPYLCLRNLKQIDMRKKKKEAVQLSTATEVVSKFFGVKLMDIASKYAKNSARDARHVLAILLRDVERVSFVDLDPILGCGATGGHNLYTNARDRMATEPNFRSSVLTIKAQAYGTTN